MTITFFWQYHTLRSYMEKYSPIILNSAGIKTAFDQNTFWSTLKVIVKHPPNIYRLLKHSWRRSSGHTFMISTKKWPILWPAYPHHPQKWKIDLFCKNNTVCKHVIYFKTLNPPRLPCERLIWMTKHSLKNTVQHIHWNIVSKVLQIVF